MNTKKAVVLLSGGLDSATVSAIAKRDGYELYAMTFRYGQRHEVEVHFAEKLASFFGVKDHIIISIPSDIFSSALMKKSSQMVPKNEDPLQTDRIPSTYVPARNILFLSYALAYAESIEASALYIGANAVDFSGYPDCRPEFFKAYQKMADIGTRAGISGAGITIITPLIHLKKSEIISMGIQLGVDYSLTHSCYDPSDDGSSCGVCDSCILRKKGFIEAGTIDPARYRAE